MNEDKPMSSMERVAESTVAKLTVRIVLPIMVAIIGYFINDKLSGVVVTQGTQGTAITAIQSDVRNLNTRMDGQVISQVSMNTNRLDKESELIERLNDRLLLIESRSRK